LTVARHEWRRKLLPECLGEAQEAVAQLRARGIPVELKGKGGDWLVFDETEGDAWVVEMLDRVWPRWRDCVSD